MSSEPGRQFIEKEVMLYKLVLKKKGKKRMGGRKGKKVGEGGKGVKG